MSASVSDSVNHITAQVATYAPAVLVGVQAAEQSGASGDAKKQAVVNGILAGSRVAEGVPNPTVQSIGALVDLTVSILNGLGVFRKKSASATA